MARKRAVYRSFCSHDCEVFYECPECGKVFGSWTVFFQNKNENGTNEYCPHCKVELEIP